MTMSSWQIVHLWETPTIFKIYEGVSAIAVNSLGTLLILLSVWWWSLWWNILSFSQSCDDNDDDHTWEAKRVARVPKTLSVTKTRLSPTSSGWFEFCKGTKLAKFILSTYPFFTMWNLLHRGLVWAKDLNVEPALRFPPSVRFLFVCYVFHLMF